MNMISNIDEFNNYQPNYRSNTKEKIRLQVNNLQY